MRVYKLTDTHGKVGIYKAYSFAGALDAMAIEAGYKDFWTMHCQTGYNAKGLIILEVLPMEPQ